MKAELCVRIANIPKKKLVKIGHTVRAVTDVEDLKTVEPSSLYKVPLICDCVLELQFLVNLNQVGTSL